MLEAVAHVSNPSIGEAEAEFKGSLVYIMRSRSAKATWGDLSQTTTTTTTTTTATATQIIDLVINMTNDFIILCT